MRATILVGVSVAMLVYKVSVLFCTIKDSACTVATSISLVTDTRGHVQDYQGT